MYDADASLARAIWARTCSESTVAAQHVDALLESAEEQVGVPAVAERRARRHEDDAGGRAVAWPAAATGGRGAAPASTSTTRTRYHRRLRLRTACQYIPPLIRWARRRAVGAALPSLVACTTSS